MNFINSSEFKREYLRTISGSYGKPIDKCTTFEKYEALVHVIVSMCSGLRSEINYRKKKEDRKKVYYFSMEFLIGKLLDNYIINLGLKDTILYVLEDLGIDYEELCSIDPDPGLGNGGLGRLSACFLDSMASLGIEGIGMGLRYKFGLFKQEFENGYQIEKSDSWLENGFPWEQEKPDAAVRVRFGGYVDRTYENGKMFYEHKGYYEVNAVPYDVPVVGYNGKEINWLHLWSAKPVTQSVDMDAFNKGDYSLAMKESNDIKAITYILYPDDSNGIGRKLRLKQEYFLVAAGLASIIRTYKFAYGSDAWKDFPEHVSIHINDTHPTLCIPELMRILMDEENLEWDDAWDITTRVISFTNHTVLPEAMEKWSIEFFKQLLPRIYMIVEEIDRRWHEKMRDESFETLKNTAILWDGIIKMANLSIIGSHSVNGVAALHTDILKEQVFTDFVKLDADKFNNKTNGISHRRFLVQANPGLTDLISDAIGDGWIKDINKLDKIYNYKNDAAFLENLARVKRENKLRLAKYIENQSGEIIDPDSVFDIQVKRIHAYKRQLLNILKVLDLYHKLKENPDLPINNYTFVFSGKAAQGYSFAKETIKFINSVKEMVNSDPVVNNRIKVVYVENFCVSNAQLIYPAADISEQISTAGKEASGTGNMKFMMNGAITLGTMDGANVEICNLVTEDNMKIFGFSSEETTNFYLNGGYNSKKLFNEEPHIKKLMEELIDGTFLKYGCDFWGIFDALVTYNDEYFVLGDFDSYTKAWRELDEVYKDKNKWGEMSVINIAKSPFFSSDRTIKEYAKEIWKIKAFMQ